MDVRRLFLVCLITAVVLFGVLAAAQQQSSPTDDSANKKTVAPGTVTTYKDCGGKIAEDCSSQQVDTPADGTEGASVSAGSTAQANNSAPATGGNTQSSSSQSCSKTIIPYQTDYINDSTMYVGETREGVPGINGYVKHCPGLADFTVDPYNHKVYVGTKARPSVSPTSPAKTYDEAANYCSGHGVSVNSSAWQPCIDAYMRS